MAGEGTMPLKVLTRPGGVKRSWGGLSAPLSALSSYYLLGFAFLDPFSEPLKGICDALLVLGLSCMYMLKTGG